MKDPTARISVKGMLTQSIKTMALSTIQRIRFFQWPLVLHDVEIHW